MYKFLYSVSIIIFILAFSVLTYGQETPKYELYTGYSLIRMNEFVSYNGATTSLTRNFTKSFSMVAEVGIFSDSRDKTFVFGDNFIRDISSAKLFTYMAGPRFSIRSNSRFTPFGQALVGGYRSSGTFSTQINGSTWNSKQVINSFASALGAGVDVTVNKRISVRPAQIDYLFLRKTNNESLRVSSGIAFKF